MDWRIYMLKAKKNIFFDMDGLLFATEKVYYETRRTVLKEYGINFEVEDYIPYMGKGFDDTIQRLSLLVKDKALGEKVFHDAMDLYYERMEKNEFEIKPGVVSLLNYLKDNQFKSYVTSSSDYEVIEKSIKSKALESYFDGYIGGDQVNENKPAPDIYLHALEKSAATAEEAVVYEDSLSGIQAANAAGIDVIAVPDLLKPNDFMKKNTLIVVKQIDETIPLFKQ